MAYTLESLQPGTPVFVGDVRVGEVRSLYASANSRQAELLVVFWSGRNEEVAVSTSEVGSVDDTGVRLIALEVTAYDSLATFDPARFPTVHLLT